MGPSSGKIDARPVRSKRQISDSQNAEGDPLRCPLGHPTHLRGEGDAMNRRRPFSVAKSMTTARIYGPAKNAMRSIAQAKSWVLDFEQASPKAIEPLMGWTSSADVRQQVRLRFDSRTEAIAYCEQNGLAYRVFEPNPAKRIVQAYADNFAYTRPVPWTH
jgi:ETC complex I subunit conserved region